jgi:sodium-dependent phosphate transporter
MNGVASPDDLQWVVVVAGLAMAYMAWGIGANDVANAFGPAFGARSLTVKQACVIACVAESFGAIVMGGHVADTIRKGMMSVKLYDSDDGRVLIMVGMTSVLIGAATWLLVASKFGLPVSTTHSAVGGVIALAITTKGYGSVKWSKVVMIVASWFISPVLSALMSFVLRVIVHRTILNHEDSMRRAKLAAPVFVFLVTFVIALFTVYKGGKGLGLHKTSLGVALGASFGIAMVCGAAAFPFVQWWAKKQEESIGGPCDGQKAVDDAQPEGTPTEDIVIDLDAPVAGPAKDAAPAVDADVEDPKKPAEQNQSKNVGELGSANHTPTERLFTGFVVILAAFFSLAHGANDVANSVGPFGAVLAAAEGPLKKKSETPIWVFVVAGVMISIGLATYGIHVMRTIGNNLVEMSPSKAFCVNFAATIVVLIATRLGIPVSTTHASVGAVVGVGLAEGKTDGVNWKMFTKIFLSWILTLPIVGVSSNGIFSMLLPCVVKVPFE